MSTEYPGTEEKESAAAMPSGISKAPKSDCVKLVCMGSPLLEIRTEVSIQFIEEFALKPNTVVSVDSSGDYKNLLAEIMKQEPVRYAAAGGAVTTAMATAALLNSERSVPMTVEERNGSQIVSVIGGVGRDVLSYNLQDYLRNNAIQPLFSEIQSESTGWMAVLYRDSQRKNPGTVVMEEKEETLVRQKIAYSAYSGNAANQYKLDHLRFKIWEHVEAAGVLYTEAYFLTVSPESVKIVAEHCAKMGNIFCLNLSAPYLCQYFYDRIMAILPFTDYVFGNEAEYMALASTKEDGPKDMDSVVTWLAQVPKADVTTKKRRHVVVTCGEKPCIVGTTWYGFGVKVMRYPVPAVKHRNFIRKDGAGDAFAGGFLYGIMHEADLDSCVQMALYCANSAVQRTGPGFTFKHMPGMHRAEKVS